MDSGPSAFAVAGAMVDFRMGFEGWVGSGRLNAGVCRAERIDKFCFLRHDLPLSFELTPIGGDERGNNTAAPKARRRRQLWNK
jgi:hypothetical protein